ncbi:MAG: nuclear transport factor 2 family protein, partial [candidate division NC10 bacterium]|nr:nuclear transport factor 2 family protein [candidate division NC10 bacterium]
MSHHTRTPREVFDHHLKAINDGNLDEIAADYTEKAFLIIPPDTILRGREAIKGLFQQALTEALPGGKFTAKTIIVEG